MRHSISQPRQPSTPWALALTCALVLGLAAAPVAQAATYIVSMTNGTTFESRYQPQEAGFDENVVLLMTEHGNWIALDRGDIEGVTTDVESSGFGTVIDDKTISLGILANDQPVPEEGGPSNEQLMREYLANQPPPPDYSVEQFVDPSQAGGGLPVGYSQAPQSPPLILTNGN